MAAKKKKRGRPRTRVRQRLRKHPPELRAWRTWVHDVDTLLHAMVLNPSLNTEPPEAIVARAEAFADAIHKLHERRRPEGIEPEPGY